MAAQEASETEVRFHKIHKVKSYEDRRQEDRDAYAELEREVAEFRDRRR